MLNEKFVKNIEDAYDCGTLDVAYNLIGVKNYQKPIFKGVSEEMIEAYLSGICDDIRAKWRIDNR